MKFDLPDPGEGIAEADLVEWQVEEGDHVDADDPVASVETDKAVVDIPIPEEATINTLLVDEGDTAVVGEPFLEYTPGEQHSQQTTEEDHERDEDDVEEDSQEVVQDKPGGGDDGVVKPPQEPSKPVKAMPRVRHKAQQEEIDLNDVDGTGPNSRITLDDVTAVVESDTDSDVTNVTTTPSSTESPHADNEGSDKDLPVSDENADEDKESQREDQDNTQLGASEANQTDNDTTAVDHADQTDTEADNDSTTSNNPEVLDEADIAVDRFTPEGITNAKPRQQSTMDEASQTAENQGTRRDNPTEDGKAESSIDDYETSDEDQPGQDNLQHTDKSDEADNTEADNAKEDKEEAKETMTDEANDDEEQPGEQPIAEANAGDADDTKTPRPRETSEHDDVSQEDKADNSHDDTTGSQSATDDDSRDKINALDGARRVIAQNMRHSVESTAQTTITEEVNVTQLVDLHDLITEDNDTPVTYLSYFVKAATKTLQAHPAFNATFDDNGVHEHDEVNIGIAVDTDRGLFVPVIQRAHRKGIEGLAYSIADLAERTRANDNEPGDFDDATFTVSSLGNIGGEVFTPILNPPQVAILGVGRIKERPRYHDDELVKANIVHLSLTIDHQVIDGADAARFLQDIKEGLESPKDLLLIDA